MKSIEVRNQFINRSRIIFTLLFSLGMSFFAIADGGGTYSIYDTDRNGYLDKTEFVKFADSRRERASSPDFWEFGKVDADGDQKISEQEMVNALMEDMKLKRQNK